MKCSFFRGEENVAIWSSGEGEHFVREIAEEWIGCFYFEFYQFHLMLLYIFICWKLNFWQIVTIFFVFSSIFLFFPLNLFSSKQLEKTDLWILMILVKTKEIFFNGEWDAFSAEYSPMAPKVNVVMHNLSTTRWFELSTVTAYCCLVSCFLFFIAYCMSRNKMMITNHLLLVSPQPIKCMHNNWIGFTLQLFWQT